MRSLHLNSIFKLLRENRVDFSITDERFLIQKSPRKIYELLGCRVRYTTWLNSNLEYFNCTDDNMVAVKKKYSFVKEAWEQYMENARRNWCPNYEFSFEDIQRFTDVIAPADVCESFFYESDDGNFQMRDEIMLDIFA